MKTYKQHIAICMIVKIILLILFSSEYIHKLFLPFVAKYLEIFPNNPWNFFLYNNSAEFPYNPLMLYILSLFYLPIKAFSLQPLWLKNFFIKAPSLLADIVILFLLYKKYPQKIKELAIFYAASPIVIYAVYIHSQLDLIPTALLFAGIYFLKEKKLIPSAILTGCALGTKFHTIAALPLILTYLLKNFKLKKTFNYACITLSLYVFLIAPYVMTNGYINLVLKHQKQMMLFDSFWAIGSLKIYLPLLLLGILYSRFLAYPKINNDLFDAFLAITFMTLVLVIPPAPGWYIWMHPFLSNLFIKYHSLNKASKSLYYAMCTSYCLFFILYASNNLYDILLFSYPINTKLIQPKIINIIFTLLEASLFVAIYFLYKFGIKSNQVYSRTQSLIVGIGGDSGAGKTTIMNDLKNILGNKALILEGDADHKWERGDKNWQTFTHLNPKANFLYKQSEDIFMLKQGQSILRTNYNHSTGKFDPPKKIKPCDVILLAGLHPLYLPKMRKLIDLKIFVAPDKKLQMHWKIIRDMHERGHPLEKILKQIKQRLSDKSDHIEPQKDFADVIITYFPQNEFEVGNPSSYPTINVKITLESNVMLDALTKNLIQQKINFVWDYSNDLKSQHISMLQELTSNEIALLANNILVNQEEIACPFNVWKSGHRGFVQLMLVYILSEKMKEKQSSWGKNMGSYSTWMAPYMTMKQHIV